VIYSDALSVRENAKYLTYHAKRAVG
jgi:hypothetical protein